MIINFGSCDKKKKRCEENKNWVAKITKKSQNFHFDVCGGYQNWIIAVENCDKFSILSMLLGLNEKKCNLLKNCLE